MADKIERLTPEQEADLPAFRQKYLDRACNGARIDRGDNDAGAIAAWNTRADDPEITRLRAENERAWRERNLAVAKVAAWEATLVVEGLPSLRAHHVDEWGPGEGETVSVPEITPQRLTEILDELALLRTENARLRGPTIHFGKGYGPGDGDARAALGEQP